MVLGSVIPRAMRAEASTPRGGRQGVPGSVPCPPLPVSLGLPAKSPPRTEARGAGRWSALFTELCTASRRGFMSICRVKEAPPAPDRCLSGSGAPPPAPRDPCAGYTQDGTPRWNQKPPLGWESGFAADTGCRGLRRRVASWWSGAASAPGHPLRGLATGSGTRPNRPDSSPACGIGPRGTQGPHETAEAQRGKCHARDAQPGGEGEPWCGTGACPPFLSHRC